MLTHRTTQMPERKNAYIPPVEASQLIVERAVEVHPEHALAERQLPVEPEHQDLVVREQIHLRGRQTLHARTGTEHRDTKPR